MDRTDLARRVVTVREQLSDALRREPSSLPVMLVSARAGVGFNNVKSDRARGGILELQKELAALVPDNNLVARVVAQQRIPRRPLAIRGNQLPARNSVSSVSRQNRKGSLDQKSSTFSKQLVRSSIEQQTPKSQTSDQRPRKLLARRTTAELPSVRSKVRSLVSKQSLNVRGRPNQGGEVKRRVLKRTTRKSNKLV